MTEGAMIEMATEMRAAHAAQSVDAAVDLADTHVFEAMGVLERFCPRLDAPAWAQARALLAIHAELRALRLASELGASQNSRGDG